MADRELGESAPHQTRLHILVPAAGCGSRFGGDRPKQYQAFLQTSLLNHTLTQLLSLDIAQQFCLGLDAEDCWWPDSPLAADSRISTFMGGDNRFETVRLGLQCLGLSQSVAPSDWILIHDAVRPCISAASLQPLLASLSDTEAAGLAPGRPVFEAVKRATADGCVVAVEDRSGLWTTQTPQIFRYGALCDAMQQSRSAGCIYDDEMSALQAAGYRTQLIAAPVTNIKVTTAEDMDLARHYWQMMSASSSATPGGE